MSEIEERLLLPRRLIAVAFGVSADSVGRWAVQPREKRGREALYYLPDVIAYRQSRNIPAQLELSRERARLAKEQADKTARENELGRAAVIPVEQAAELWERICTNIRTRILALPSILAPRVVGLSAAKVQKVADELCREALTELSDGDPGWPVPARPTSEAEST